MLVLLAVWSTSVMQAQENEPQHTLFVGNSFTFFWNMPQLVQAMATHQGVALTTGQSTVGGSNWQQHWEGQKNTQTRKRLQEESWDIVVLQDHSQSTLDFKPRFHEFGGKFIDLVRAANAEPVLFMTWAYRSNPLMQESITREYTALAKATKTRVVPVGPVFEKARALRPDLELFFDDKHTSPDGSYLIALVFYKTLTGKSVADIPDRLFETGPDGEKRYHCFVLPATGKFLRDLVDGFDVKPYNFSEE